MRKGDAVLIHTGFGKLWGVDNAKYNAGTPGIGVGAAEFLARAIRCCSAPTPIRWRSIPIPTRSISLPIHQLALSVYGIFLLENMKLDELAAKKVYEFALVVQPLKIKGGTGSTVAPIAIR